MANFGITYRDARCAVEINRTAKSLIACKSERALLILGFGDRLVFGYIAVLDIRA